MKNFKLLSVLLASGVLLTACSSGTSTSSSESSTTTTQAVKKEEKKTYALGEEWVVEGQWKLKINSVTVTSERNEFSEDKPAEVVVIDYTYENLGYEGDILKGLYLAPANVVDGGKKVAKTYPAGVKNYPQETPQGAVSENSQAAYGLNTVSNEITVVFDHYDGNKKQQRAEFKVPVKK